MVLTVYCYVEIKTFFILLVTDRFLAMSDGALTFVSCYNYYRKCLRIIYLYNLTSKIFQVIVFACLFVSFGCLFCFCFCRLWHKKPEPGGRGRSRGGFSGGYGGGGDWGVDGGDCGGGGGGGGDCGGGGGGGGGDGGGGGGGGGGDGGGGGC